MGARANFPEACIENSGGSCSYAYFLNAIKIPQSPFNESDSEVNKEKTPLNSNLYGSKLNSVFNIEKVIISGNISIWKKYLAKAAKRWYNKRKG